MLPRVIFSSAIGTILEWYDFSLFAFLTPLLANLFFPHEMKFTGVMLTYTIFAIGYFVRPIGAAIFGHLGDRIGRKKTLIFSILLMAIPTFCIGLLPTYNTVGLLAPVLLIVLRICQGLSVGGESIGATLFVIESGHYKYRGFLGGLLWAVIGIGMLLGSFAASMVIYYSDYAWSWRIPFLLGILTGLIGYVVRKRIPETLFFQNILQQGKRVKAPLCKAFTHYKIEMFRIMGFYALSAMITYLIFIFMPTYAATIIGYPLSQVSFICTLTMACSIFLVPIGGLISDKIGRKQSLRYPAIGLFLLSYPLFVLIAQGTLTNFIYAQIIFVLLAAWFQGSINAAVIEQLPTSVRYSVTAVGYNIAYSLFAGTSPIIASYLVKLTHDKAATGLYLMCGALIAIIATMTNMRETHRLSLSQIEYS